ncbi:alpha-glucan phosphorylase [Acidihalobacter yilgarnensis]|uniref:Alpha-glucan phosphorylase n=1 Tax=Acidihalobacter yilgarnensis TaxID=2819280 RepID=A0A1D8IMM2_9GAMM|nr:alpha-glucan family phosphorylase [Acidihalobacter yilgarnensis]AOU97675.1 alpha-glucan phosphorylase [Acidihalobacter yilgarnensis]
MNAFQRYLTRTLPEPLSRLTELALDLRWSWSHASDALWETLDPELWAATANPWLILESVSRDRLNQLADDATFRDELERQLAEREASLNGPTWFGEIQDTGNFGTVAYFSMEFGLSESLPIYSGGLGILAGDMLKTASDLGVPMVGVGLLYQQGYFRQALNIDGEQLAYYPYNDPAMLPVMPLRNGDGGWLRVTVELPGRPLQLRCWEARVGRARLLLLDANDLVNGPRDRGITGELYGGDTETRLTQEVILGIGGWRMLERLGLPVSVCHLNEGHAALAVFERAASFRRQHGTDFEIALRATRAGNLFTTHTPVPAAFDRFPPALVRLYLTPYADQWGLPFERILQLGRIHPDTNDADEDFVPAYLALRGCGAANGVSRLHGEVSRHLFAPMFPRRPLHEVPIGHVTNGVHTPSWDSRDADQLWTQSCGKSRWIGDLTGIGGGIRGLDDATLWEFRGRSRQSLIKALRARLARQRASLGAAVERIDECALMLDPNALTLGFARRFTAYKRTNLLLTDPDRLSRLLTNTNRPVQLVLAGKAHPRDWNGQRMIKEWSEFIARPELRGRVVFVEDYDMAVAATLVEGVDLWINTPRRPWEASGTSGMKVLVNGGLNLSELDGWWAEAYAPEVGWAIGDRCEHDADPAWDASEAKNLYRLLEEEIVPLFYTRDQAGIPPPWVARIRESMARLTPAYSSNRMLREYVEHYYLPQSRAIAARQADNARLGTELEAWHRRLKAHWGGLRIGDLSWKQEGNGWRADVQVYLDDLGPDDIAVELYAEPNSCHRLQRMEPLAGAIHGYRYSTTLSADCTPDDYTARIVPTHPAASVPLEATEILWQPRN